MGLDGLGPEYLPVNPLAGKPLRYLIGTDNPPSGQIGEIIEVGYDVATPPPVGLAIAYVNLFDETNSGRFPPYRDPTDTAEEYDEGVPDAGGSGFEANLREQFQRRREQGFRYVELDNPDAYLLPDVMRATALAESYGLGVIAKNPGAMGGDVTAWLAHPNVFGVIVEQDAGGPAEMHALRSKAGRSDLPVWFVFFGGGRSEALSFAGAISRNSYPNMYVTFSEQGEYGSSEDVGAKKLPSVFEPGATIPNNLGNSMAWRLAKSLETLRDQVNAKWPNRDKSSDGTIGDQAHAATNSDHNPNSADVVTAMDITDDPSHGLVARSLAEALVASRDPRIKYIISNAQIVSSLQSPWVWRPYNGANAHRAHVHISVMGAPALYDDAKAWTFGAPVAPARASSVRRFTDIVATEFGGRADPNNSAYDNHFIDDDEFGVALPFRFKGERPAVRVFKDGKSVVCEIVDVGPWNINDPYWETGSRPQAETGIDNTGRRTNKAGIDLTPLAANAIGLNGLGKVDWEFVGAEPVIITQKPAGNPMPSEPTKFNAAVEDTLDEIRPILEKRFAALQAAAPTSEQALDDIITRLGGTPPKRAPKLLPPPSESTPVTPVPATTGSNVATNIGVGLAGILASLGLSGAGVIGTPIGPDASLTGLLLPIGIGIASALGIPAPLASMLGNLVSSFGKKAFADK